MNRPDTARRRSGRRVFSQIRQRQSSGRTHRRSLPAQSGRRVAGRFAGAHEGQLRIVLLGIKQPHGRARRRHSECPKRVDGEGPVSRLLRDAARERLYCARRSWRSRQIHTVPAQDRNRALAAYSLPTRALHREGARKPRMPAGRTHSLTSSGRLVVGDARPNFHRIAGEKFLGCQGEHGIGISDAFIHVILIKTTRRW